MHHRGATSAERKRHPDPTWEILVLYDGECPLCRRETGMLARREDRCPAPLGGEG